MTPTAGAAAPAIRGRRLFQSDDDYPHIVPIARLFGLSGNVTTTQNTVLRNQPYAARNVPVAIVCV